MFANRAFEIGALTLVPATNKIAEHSKDAAMDEYVCTLLDETGEPRMIISKPQGVQFTSPIWKCKIDPDRTKCNCEVRYDEHPYKPPLSKTAAFKRISLPVVTNFKAIGHGDEIIVFKSLPQKKPSTTPKGTEPAPKKRRAA